MLALSSVMSMGATAQPFLTPSQHQMVQQLLSPHLNYFLSSQVIASSGLPRTALKPDVPGAYRHSNPAEWGYAMLGWIRAADNSQITVADATARLNTAFGTLETLRSDPSQSSNNLFYFIYDVFAANGTGSLPEPSHWTGTDEYIPSIDNGILTTSLLIAEGWARHRGNLTLAGRAHALWSTMDYSRFVVTVAGRGKLISHGIKPSTNVCLSDNWDVFSDEGGLMAWIAYVTGSISASDLREIVGNQYRWHGKGTDGVVPEGSWFSAMFAWGVRSFSGFPIATWETGARNRFAQSFAAAVRGHLSFAARKGIYYPGFSDAMTQLYTSNYAPPNLTGGESTFPHILPHALVVPLCLGRELDFASRNFLLAKISDLMTDGAVYYHDGSTGYPAFGFEVVASPQHNITTYAGVASQGGRHVWETLSQTYISQSLANALAINDGGMTLMDYASLVPGYSASVQTALGVMYPASHRVPADFSTIQSAVKSSIYQDVITVSAGVYPENLVIDRGIVIEGTNGGVATPSNTADDSTIDGGSGLVRTILCQNNLISGGLLDGVELRGLTIRNGGKQDGSNICFNRVSGVISRCWIHDGYTQHANSPVGSFGGYGGGTALLSGSSAVVVDSVFENNNAWGCGGGAYVSASDAIFARNTFRNNQADNGGGIHITGTGSAPVQITNNVLTANTTSYQHGGGVFATGAAPVISNNTFVGNKAIIFGNGFGGGIYLVGSGANAASVFNNIFHGNQSAQGGAAVHCDANLPALSLSYNDAYANTLSGGATSSYSNCVAGMGSQTTDPLFVSLAGNDYRLLGGSPAIHAGSGMNADGTTADLGAYGGGGFGYKYADWISRYPSLTGMAADQTADPDGDGISNGMEYLAGTSPASTNASQLPVMTFSGGDLTIQYATSNLAAAQSHLEGSSDLVSWAVLAGAEQRATPQGEFSLHTLTVPVDSGKSRFFVRLVVTPQ